MSLEMGDYQYPKGLTATAMGDGSIRLEWDATDDPGFVIYQSLSDRDMPVPIASTTRSECTLRGLEPNAIHWFRVQAFGDRRQSMDISIVLVAPEEVVFRGA